MNSETSLTRRPASAPSLPLLKTRSAKTAAGLLALLGIALVVRFYGLTYHSLWFDEVMSTVWAARPAGQIWQVGMTLVQDKHPPLYYLLLHFWTAIFGPGDSAVRTLGVLIGALAVLPAYGLGASLGGWRAGALGALFLAINPYLVWYSQEARMFMPATTFVLVGLYGALLIWAGRPRRSPAPLREPSAAVKGRVTTGRLAVGMALVIVGFTAALYSYLLTALMLPVAGAWLLLLCWQAARSGERGETLAPPLVANLVALAIVVGLFLPLARAAWSVSGQESLPGRAFEALAPALHRMLQVYSFGSPPWPMQAMSGVVVGAALLMLVGLVAPVGGKPSVATGHWGGVLLALWLGLPVVIGGWLLTRDRTMFAEARYFIFLAPALCLAWGRALAWLWERCRPAGFVGLALACGVILAALPADWSAQNRREAWREAAAFIQARAGPNDAVLIQPDYIAPALTRYLRASLPVYYPFTDRVDDPAEVEAPLQGLGGYDAVWLVQSHHQELDPDGLVAGWFAARHPLITEAYPAGISVHAFAQRYRSPAPPAAPAGVPQMNRDFGNLRLLGCMAQPESLKARENLYHPPSGWVHVTTYWTATAPLEEDVYPRLRMVDSTGGVWGEGLERRGDALHVWPSSRWQPGEVVRADHDVNLNPVTPPGSYRIVVGVPGSEVQASCGNVLVTQ
jgi:4-amino-4-deoxy-L-arabinose transferase-like glycosyltransferase